MVLRNSASGPIQLSLIQLVRLLPPATTARIVPMMIAEDMVIARPMKARDKVFLPAAAFAGSSPEKTYW